MLSAVEEEYKEMWWTLIQTDNRELDVVLELLLSLHPKKEPTNSGSSDKSC